MTGSRPLLLAVAVVWGVVWLTTQTLPATPLATAPTVGIGVLATLVAVWWYPSIVGGPRRRSGLSAASIEAPTRDALAPTRSISPPLQEGQSHDAIVRSAALLLPITGGSKIEITDTQTVLGAAAKTPAGPQARNAGYSHSRRLHVASVDAIKNRAAAWREEAPGFVVAVPLKVDDEVAGSLCVTFDEPHARSFEQLEAIASFLSLYMENDDLAQQAQLAADARLDALRAQINPHFLFNTLNTIASKSRTDADEARQLLQRLADFFRYATQQEGQFAEFAHEYFFVRTYLSLEQARFSERLDIQYDIDPQVLPVQVPVLVIQPLVENAVKHGIAPQAKGGTLTLRARVDALAGSIRISVRDNGVGIEPELLADVAAGTYRASSGGVGLRNIHERLEQLYGARYQFDIRSSPGKGTRIELELPL